jgi:hypothetical protein
MVDAMGKSGHVTPSEEQMRANLENAGFVDVQTFRFKQPVGPWAKSQYGSLECVVFPNGSHLHI